MASAVQQRLETEAKAFEAARNEHTKMVNTHAKLMGQYNENDMVLKELNLVEEDAKVYKLIGPVLLNQDLDEAKTNVEKRLQYIGDEIKRTNTHMEELDKKMEEKKAKIMQLQQQAQAAMQKKAAQQQPQVAA
uniref:Prefoldin subunit 6 n=2 Tax=Hemiselmis andersenii TaxID=464988 RepID=A0A6T8P8D2_HEMAN